jgi:Tol biopolymer transport system component
MTSFTRFEASLPELFEELALPQVPDYFDDILTRTAATRQRPGWSFPERWLSMSALARRLPVVPRIPWRLGVVIALLAVAALIAALVSGSLLKTRPAPYGPAINGQIVFVDGNGQIVTGEPIGGTKTTIVPGIGFGSPIYSQDGTRLAFTQRASASAVDLIVSDPDGTHLTKLTTTPVSTPRYIGWSPRGDRLALIDASGRILLFSTQAAGQPTVLSDQLSIGTAEIGPGYNYRSAMAFRPPNGDEIMFITNERPNALMAAKLDGTTLRSVIDSKTSAIGYSNLTGAQWSPDGSKVLVMADLPAQPGWSHLYLVNADGTDVRPLSDLSTDPLVGVNSPMWSPDGTRVAFQYWTRHTEDSEQDYHPIGVVDVATGALNDVGPTSTNGYASWEWSPDGSSILEIPMDGSGRMLIVNATTGVEQAVPWQVGDASSWQRTAR